MEVTSIRSASHQMMAAEVACTGWAFADRELTKLQFHGGAVAGELLIELLLEALCSEL